MLIVLKILCDLYSEPNEQGIAKVIKKDVEYLKQFDTTKITVEQYINPKTAKVIKKYCLVIENEKYYKANHKFEELVKLDKHVEVKGFKVGLSKKK